MIDVRFHTAGWRIGIGPFFIRWQNNRPQYIELCIGRIKSKDFQHIGGMTWREWRLARAQQKQAKQEAFEKFKDGL